MLIDFRKLIRVLPIKRGRAFLIKKLSGFFDFYRYDMIEVFGHAIKIDLRDNASIALYLNYGKIRLEREIFSILKEIVEPDDVFWDVGANIGYYTLYLTDKCKVISFEPNHNLFSFLKDAILAYNNVSVFDYALSNADEEKNFYLNEGSSDLSSLIDNGEGKNITVTSKTVDSLIFDKEFMPPTIIKIDVEGYEFYVLDGFKRINDFKPIIIFEYLEIFGEKLGITLKAIINLLGKDWLIFRFMSDGKLNDNYREINLSTNNYLAIHKSDKRLFLIKKMIIEK